MNIISGTTRTLQGIFGFFGQSTKQLDTINYFQKVSYKVHWELCVRVHTRHYQQRCISCIFQLRRFRSWRFQKRRRFITVNVSMGHDISGYRYSWTKIFGCDNWVIKNHAHTLSCTALCRQMRWLVSLSKLSTVQLRPHPYWESMAHPPTRH